MATCCSDKTNELLKPYEYCQKCFNNKINELKPSGACSSQKYNGKIDYAWVSHLDRVKYMSFGVQKWLYDKALNGCEESLFKIDYGYNLHEEVINKAKEEKLI
jgi:hypothetical protein